MATKRLTRLIRVAPKKKFATTGKTQWNHAYVLDSLTKSVWTYNPCSAFPFLFPLETHLRTALSRGPRANRGGRPIVKTFCLLKTPFWKKNLLFNSWSNSVLKFRVKTKCYFSLSGRLQFPVPVTADTGNYAEIRPANQHCLCKLREMLGEKHFKSFEQKCR